MWCRKRLNVGHLKGIQRQQQRSSHGEQTGDNQVVRCRADEGHYTGAGQKHWDAPVRKAKALEIGNKK